MEGETLIVTAKVIAHAFDSKNAIQYFPGDTVQLDLANRDQRKLVWLRTPRGKWIFEFDRANSNSPALRMFFCTHCGQPFDKFNEMGTHMNEFHNKLKAISEQAKRDAADELEEKLLANEPIVDEPIVTEKRGKKKGRSYTCKTCGDVQPNPYAMRIHYRVHEKPIEVPTAETTQQV